MFNKTYYESKFQEFEVAVVIHGNAYDFFVKNPTTKQLQHLHLTAKKHLEMLKRIKSMSEIYDVSFMICNIGMKRLKIDQKKLIATIKVLPNAAIGLIDKQNEGYAYLLIE
ncbi:MAG: DsrE family protein [Epsilonproteobacteria bacterium]|nr:DsrE family protein [Campylobacterota bacterium]